MATVSQITGAVRRKVGFPSEDTLSNGVIEENLVEVLDELVTELSLSSQSWIVPRFILTVNPQQEYYSIDALAPDYGRGQFATTYKTGDPNFHTRPIDIVDEPEEVKYFGGGDPGPTGILHSARAFAQLYKDGEHFLRVAPIPQMQAEYLIVYKPATQRPESEQNEAFRLPQFDQYVYNLVAQLCLPYAKLDEVTHERVEKMLTVRIARGDLQFRRFRRSDRQTNNFRAIPFGASRWRRWRW